jgi:hypothetical protein
VHLMGMHLMGVHLMGVHLMGVHLMHLKGLHLSYELYELCNCSLLKDHVALVGEQGSEFGNIFLKFSVFPTEKYRNLYSLQLTGSLGPYRCPTCSKQSEWAVRWQMICEFPGPAPSPTHQLHS